MKRARHLIDKINVMAIIYVISIALALYLKEFV